MLSSWNTTYSPCSRLSVWRGTSGLRLMCLLAGLLLMVASRADAADSKAGAKGSAPASPAGEGTTPAAPEKLYYIRTYRVLGASGILSRDEVEQAVYPYLGPERTVEDVDKARAALERTYQDKGYQTVSVLIPPQQVKGGIVVLQVIEGKVDRLRVHGSRYFLPSDIKGEAPSLAEGTVPNFNDVTRDILGLNQDPDRRVTPALKASETPGMVDVDLNVKDKPPLHGSVDVDNRYSANTTSLRTSATISYDNLWQLGHSLSLTYQVAPENPRDAQVFSGSYLARIPDLPWLSFLLYGLKSDSNVATVGSINVAGKGDIAGIRAVMTLPTLRETGFYHTFSFGIDYKNFDETVDLGGVATESPITYYPLTATYSGTLQDKTSVTQFNAGVTFGIDGMGSTPATFDAKGFKTAANYIYFRGDFSRTQELPFGLQAYGKIQGQIADEPLVNSEQFSAGGLDTVRGYLESEALGDNGAVGQFELRSPSLGTWFGSTVDEWRFYAFGDAAYLTINSPLPEVITNYELASAGIGTRLRLVDHLSGSFDLERPFLTGPNTQADIFAFTFKLSADF